MILIDEPFKEALRKFLDSERTRQAEIAEKTGIQQSSISRWISGETKNMGDDSWIKIWPYLKPYLPEGYVPRDPHGKNKIFLIDSYSRINYFTIEPEKDQSSSIAETLEAVMMKYFRELPNDATKLKAITMTQLLTENEEKEEAEEK